jgi:hypothetical protein
MNTPSSTFGFARTVLESTVFLEIAADEYSALLAAKDFVLEVLSFEEKFDLVVSNHIELEKTLNDVAAEHMVRQEYDYDSMHDVRVLINQRVQNLLSAARLYLDHGAHHCGNLEAVVPNLATEFDVLRTAQYDKCDSYRIAEALRNHSQHRGFPIDTYTSQNGWVDRSPEGRDVMLHRIDMHLDVDELRRGGRVKEAVLQDIESRGKRPDARPILREYVDRLSRLHEATRLKLKGPLAGREALIEGAMQRFKAAFPGERSIIGLAAVQRDPHGWRIAQTGLFQDMIDRRRRFLRRNPSLINLARRHVSSEPQLPKKPRM